MTLLFISDLHLHENRPLVTEAFFSFLKHETNHSESLYILGDLFDTWIGDDDDRPLPTEVARQLRELRERGTNIFFQHGNRDFLIGKNYASKCHMEILPELFVISHNAEHWLLAHGDQFCTRDTAYQEFRSQLRDPAWQSNILAKPLAERRLIAVQLREKSREANSLKAESIMDVTPSTIEKVMAEYNCSKLIHGHTHRPARHTLTIHHKQVERIVLGEWDQSFWFLRAQQTNLDLLERPLT